MTDQIPFDHVEKSLKLRNKNKTWLAGELTEKTGKNITPQHLSNWKSRGIPLQYNSSLKKVLNIVSENETSEYVVSTKTRKAPLISTVQAGSWSEAVEPFVVGSVEEWIETTTDAGERSFG